MAYWRLLIPLTYMAGLFLLSSIPDTDSPSTLAEEALLLLPPSWQNLLHIPLYGGLAISWIWSLSASPLSPRLCMVVGILLTMGWGIIDEIYQATVPGRFGSFADMGLNLLGAAVAAALIHRTSLVEPKRREGQP